MRSLLGIAACFAIVGCDSEGVVRPAQVGVRIVNTAASYGPVTVRRERTTLASLQYSGGLATSFDSGPYEFSLVYTPVLTGIPVQPVVTTQDLSPSNDYAFIVVAPDDVLDLLIVTLDDSSVADSVIRISITHAHPGLDALDVYLAPAGSDLSLLVPNATISYGPVSDSFEVAPGTPHMFITPANTPGTILFESADLNAPGGTGLDYVVAENGDVGFSPLEVFNITGTAQRVFRADIGAELRVFQGIDDRTDRDVLINDSITPLVSPAEFSVLSADEAISAGAGTVNITPVAVPGTIEATEDYIAAQGRNYLAVVAGDTTNGVEIVVGIEDRRHIVDQGTLNIVNAAGLFDAVDFYLLPPGTDPTTAAPSLAAMTAPAFVNRIGVAPSDYEITVIDSTTSTVLAGPEPISIESGGLYGIAFSNSAGGSTIDLSYFYDLAP